MTGNMEASGHLWGVLLAGRDEIRLRDLTTSIVGDDRPKQFCPVVGAKRASIASLCSVARISDYRC